MTAKTNKQKKKHECEISQQPKLPWWTLSTLRWVSFALQQQRNYSSVCFLQYSDRLNPPLLLQLFSFYIQGGKKAI